VRRRRRAQEVRSERSILHLDRCDDQTSVLRGLVAIAKSSAWKAQSSKGVNRGCGWPCECVHVPLRVFSCGEAEQGDALGGAMQCGGGGWPSVAR
jgi:hypothetical protein